VSARLNAHVHLQAQGDGNVTARFDDFSLPLGQYSFDALKRAQGIGAGLPLASFSSAAPEQAERQRGRRERRNLKRVDREIALLVERLAQTGLLEYRLSRANKDLAIIEPQVAGYWPKPAKCAATDTIVLSRFAYLRRRGNDLVLESPRAAALFRICDPRLASLLATLSSPQKIGELRKQPGFAGLELIGLLLDCDILFKVGKHSGGLRPSEGDEKLVVWDFHDLLFHTRSTEGRQSSPIGGRYPHVDTIAPPPAVRAPWAGEAIDLQKFASAAEPSSFARLLRERHSTRDFDEAQPIRLAELARFLESAARVQWRWSEPLDFGGGDVGPEIAYTRRPYPSAGSAYELELYLAVNACEGLPRGFYHYDAERHALVPIPADEHAITLQFEAAQYAMAAPMTPQILFTIAARFDRVSWKYSAIAYSLILKDVGALLQTLYLTATDMNLGGCAIGTGNIELFARMTGQDFHREGPVGQFALGRGRNVGGDPLTRP
jgi:SagB-type dehydrogenase family enzyme